MAAIEQAAAANKFAFVFFWKEKNPQTDKAWGVLQPGGGQNGGLGGGRGGAGDRPRGEGTRGRYDVSRAPMPLVLAIAPCGAITKAFTGKFTEANCRRLL